jgi:hypothetical protein
MRPRWRVLSIAAALLPPISAQAQTDFVSDKSFSDKTVKIIVGMPPAAASMAMPGSCSGISQGSYRARQRSLCRTCRARARCDR